MKKKKARRTIKEWLPVPVDLMCTDDYRKKSGLPALRGSIWHCQSPDAPSRIVALGIAGAEENTKIDLLVLEEENELVAPIPIEVVCSQLHQFTLPWVAPGKMVLVGLTRKAERVTLGFSKAIYE